MPSVRRAAGDGAESYVVRYLDALGYQILTTNYEVPRIGEIDIIARRGQEIYFVEVKARSDENPFGGMEGCISSGKLHRIRRCADIYLQQGRFDDSGCRLVGAFVHITPDKKYEKIRLVPLD
jgi:putative endonuclease